METQEGLNGGGSPRPDRLRDVIFSPDEGLVVDEVCLAMKDIDDVKALVDLKKPRDITCRNKDGHIPPRTPCAFSTNWSWEEFWPREVFSKDHIEAIQRRIVWVNVTADLRKQKTADVTTPVVRVQDAEDEDSDPFGFGFGMDPVD